MAPNIIYLICSRRSIKMNTAEPNTTELCGDTTLPGITQSPIEGQIKDRHFFVDQRLFCGMIRRVGTIDASAVREMNL